MMLGLRTDRLCASSRDSGHGRETMPRVFVYPFRYCSKVTGKGLRARYVAERQVIAERYAEWEIIGPPEIRDVDPHAGYFNPFRRPARAPRFRYPADR